MGKIAKRRRTQLRNLTLKHEKQIAQMGKLLTESEQRRLFAESRLKRIVDRICDCTPASAFMLLQQSVAYAYGSARVPVRDRMNYLCQAFLRDHEPTAPIFEELMAILLYDRAASEMFARCMHFRVRNPPGRSDFTMGYAVTHAMVEHLRDRRAFVRHIAENIADGIWNSIFGGKPQGSE